MSNVFKTQTIEQIKVVVKKTSVQSRCSHFYASLLALKWLLQSIHTYTYTQAHIPLQTTSTSKIRAKLWDLRVAW